MLKTIFQTVGILRICDVLSGQGVAGNQLQFRLPQSVQVVPKGDGFFVLIGSKPAPSITIESPRYQSLTVTDFTADVCYLWLTPKQQSNSIVRKITTLPHQTCYAYCQTNLKLLQDKPAEQRCIQLFMERNLLLEGRTMAFVVEDQVHIANIVDKTEQGYLLDRDLPACSKIKTRISILYAATADKDGNCMLILPDENEYTVIDEQGQVVDG